MPKRNDPPAENDRIMIFREDKTQAYWFGFISDTGAVFGPWKTRDEAIAAYDRYLLKKEAKDAKAK